jgi:mono/diheme cytochrome c family protein
MIAPDHSPAQPFDQPVAEPKAGNAPVPMWLVALLGLLFYWGQMNLHNNGGGFRANVYSPYASIKHVEAANPKPATDPRFEQGRGIYMTYCASCHQNDGQGSAIQAPPLAGSDWVLAEHPNRIIRIVLNGLQGPITVSGKSYTFNNVMLPWKDTLNDEQLAAVLTFIRGNKEWGNSASPVTPTQIAPIRKATAGKDGNWSPEELLKIALGAE